ncbi:MAG: hypothetical protein IKZ04_05900 [Spirochaetaceae bacterium]|nr:hypothetical protein [Spirochaetaceae bacterium]
MKITKKRQMRGILCAACFFLISFSVFSNTASDFSDNTEIDVAVFEELVKNGRVDRTSYKINLEPVLCPKTELGKKILNNWTSEEEPVYIAESLFYLKKENDKSNIEISEISMLMRKFSTMEGIKYYSNSSKKIETLYSEAYTIENPVTMKKIPDQTDITAKDINLYLYQKDNSFGKTVHGVNIQQEKNEILMTLNNVEPIKFSFITAVKNDNLKMSLLLIDKSDYILTYICAQLRFPALSIFEERVNDSFRARIDAMYEWFKKNYNEYIYVKINKGE